MPSTQAQPAAAALNPALPETITVDFQPYGCVILGNLHWAVESERDWNSGGTKMRHRTILRGTVIEGRERSYLLGHVGSRDIAGTSSHVYGVTQAEIDRGHIVRVAM